MSFVSILIKWTNSDEKYGSVTTYSDDNTRSQGIFIKLFKDYYLMISSFQIM